MDRVYERRHANFSGSMVASITEHDDGHYTLSCRFVALEGWDDLSLDMGAFDVSSVAEAQQVADEQIALTGHECVDGCEPWPL